METRINIPEAIELYQSGLSCQKIAKYYGLKSRLHVSRVLKRFGVKMRQPYRPSVKPMIEADKQKITDWYQKGYTKRAMAEKLGYIQAVALGKYIREWGLPKPASRTRQVAIAKNREQIISWYCEAGLSSEIIGQKFGTTAATIRRHLKSWGIQLKNTAPCGHKIVPHKEQIITWYCYWGLSTLDIAAKLGVHNLTVRNYLKKWGIKIRHISQALPLAIEYQRLEQIEAKRKRIPYRLRHGNLQATAEEYKVAELVAYGANNNEIAEQLNISVSTVTRKLSRLYQQYPFINRNNKRDYRRVLIAALFLKGKIKKKADL